MTNPTPPEPRQPILGFDELVGVILAFGTMGAILLTSLLGQNSDSIVPSLSVESASPSQDQTKDAEEKSFFANE